MALSLLCVGSASAAGTQGLSATTTALTNVNSATTVTQLQTAVQGFLDQYGVTFSTTAVNNSTFTSTTLTDSDLATAKNLSIILIEEWAKYTSTWVTDSNLQTFYAVKDLVVVNAPGSSGKRCASFSNTSNFVIYDITCSALEPGERMNMHHEYAHYLIYEKFGAFTFDSSTWTGYNPAGFSYGAQGDNFSTYGNAGWFNSEHPQSGFVSNYARTAIEEDFADVYTYIFTTQPYEKLATWIASDTNLANKVNRFKTFIATVDVAIDSSYLTTIHDFATTNNTAISIPFTGPGEQSYDPNDGSLIWYIPSNITATTGVGIGGDIFKQTLILDGTLTGGGFSGVNVLNNGRLMGTGTASLFIEVDAGGILSPGHSPGCLTTGNLTINGTLEAELGGTTACSGYDQMKANGTVDVSGGTLSASLYNNFKPTAGQTYTIISNDGSDAVTGYFESLAEGTTFKISGYVFKISYKGGTGNDVVLTVVSVPQSPNTGFGIAKSQPLEILAITLLSTGIILGVARLKVPQKLK